MKIVSWLIDIAILLTTAAVILALRLAVARRKKKHRYPDTLYPLW